MNLCMSLWVHQSVPLNFVPHISKVFGLESSNFLERTICGVLLWISLYRGMAFQKLGQSCPVGTVLVSYNCSLRDNHD